MKKSTKKLPAVMMCTAMTDSAPVRCSNGDSQTAVAAAEAPTQDQTIEETKEAAAEFEKAEESKEGTEVVALAVADVVSAGVRKKDPDKHYEFGYACMDETNPFFATIEKRMRETVEASGDELTTVDPASDVTLQIIQVEGLVPQNIDVIFMNPVRAGEILPTLDQFKEAGIPIVGFDAEVVDIFYLISYTGSDNYNVGKVCGGDLVKKCPDGRNIIVLDFPTINSVVDRASGFLDAVRGKGSNTATQQDAKGNLKVSTGVAEGLLQVHGDAAVIFGGSDLTTLGALVTANVAGPADCTIYGVDGSLDIKAEVTLGESLIEGSGAQSPIRIVQSAVNIMHIYLNGDKVELRYPVETFLTISGNVNKYSTDGWQ